MLKFRNKEYFKSHFEEWLKSTQEYLEIFDIQGIDDLFDEISDTYDRLRCNDEISDFRGKLFEVIMREKYSTIYCKRDSIMEYGCKVIIDKKEIIYEDIYGNPDYNKKTVDIAGYNFQNAEFYEIKVGPRNFKYNIILYLNKLFDSASKNKISQNLSIGCITMEKRVSLIQNLEAEKKNCDFLNYSNIMIIGREDITKRFFN
ncbi:hypothetical protein [Clostridium kluyveri]|uniref:Uncharacterized protein n=2 Tax=Clostridium kluyveri TaxID=1534 RepID=A5N0C6_CLOK5|nr:hypothetical protein [Clostridium kluyveri]EDK34572.1 Conserved hypothetical protein [Clostridium kluyveri DSM 555]BAH07319.1 hypothetical protein CKR_2268 [Clostridium kluyveri NBRC 12016]